MRLEDYLDVAPLVQRLDAEQALADLCGMVGIVAQIDHLFRLDAEVEPAVHTAETGHGRAYLLRCEAGDLCQRHGGDAIFNIHHDRNAQADVADIA